MEDEIRDKERHTEILKAANEEKEQELSLTQKKAEIKRLKREFGTDWKGMVGGALKHIKVNKEGLQTLHSLGMGGDKLRDLSNPAFLRKPK